MPRRHRNPHPDPAVFAKLEAALHEDWIVRTQFNGSWSAYKASKREAADAARQQRPTATHTERVGLRDARAILAKFLAR